MPRARAWRQPRSAPRAPRHAIALGSAKQLRWARTRARSNPVAARRRSISRVSSCATRPPAFLRRLHPETSRHREPGSLEIMLRLLTIALPLVVAFLATFDEQEVDALQLEVQSPLQFQVRSPPEFRPLRPAATRDQHDSPATAHSTPHARHPPSAHITMDAPRRYNPGKTTHPTIYFVTKTNLFRAPSTGVPPARHAEQLRPALPLRARGRCTCCTRTRDVCSRACPTP